MSKPSPRKPFTWPREIIAVLVLFWAMAGLREAADVTGVRTQAREYVVALFDVQEGGAGRSCGTDAFLDGDRAADLGVELEETFGAWRPKVANIVILPDRVRILIESFDRAGELDEYTWACGALSGPVALKDGQYDPSYSFRFEDVPWDRFPVLGRGALAQSSPNAELGFIWVRRAHERRYARQLVSSVTVEHATGPARTFRFDQRGCPMEVPSNGAAFGMLPYSTDPPLPWCSSTPGASG